MNRATKTPAASSSTTRAALAAILPACTLRHGTYLSGAGPARYGWHAVTASGSSRFLGLGREEALARAGELGSLFGT